MIEGLLEQFANTLLAFSAIRDIRKYFDHFEASCTVYSQTVSIQVKVRVRLLMKFQCNSQGLAAAF